MIHRPLLEDREDAGRVGLSSLPLEMVDTATSISPRYRKASWSDRLMTTRSAPASPGTSRHKYWPGFNCLSPNASNMSARAIAAASLACALASEDLYDPAAGATGMERARTLDRASAIASRFFIGQLTYLIDFCGFNARGPSRVPSCLPSVPCWSRAEAGGEVVLNGNSSDLEGRMRIKAIAAVSALVGWAALALQLILIIRNLGPVLGVWRFVGFFTILVNIGAAASERTCAG